MGLFRRKEESARLKREILKESIDFGNVIGSAFHSKVLYDQLKVKYHPDRFLDETMREKANTIFQRIVENKANYNALLLLKEQAEKELTFNND